MDRAAPELALEDDAEQLLKVNEELTRLLLNDPEAARCDLGQRLFGELEELRGLNERRELERAKSALEMEVGQKGLLLKEVNHRIRNSLQIVASILNLQGAHVEHKEAAAALQNASARVLAIAAVHERLFTGNDIRVVHLGTFITSLCANIGDAVGRASRVDVDLASVEVPTDLAIPIALAVNELLTNAIKYGRPPYRVSLKVEGGHLLLTVNDAGEGPARGEKRSGFGSRIVQAVSKQLAATLETTRGPEGYLVTLSVPLQAAAMHESISS